jgi:hypothetical protein
MVKLDVEGLEFDVLKGGDELINRFEPVMICELLDIDVGIALINFMKGRKYRTYFTSFSAYNPQNFRGNKENSFGHAQEASLLFVPVKRPLPRQTIGVNIQSIDKISDLAKCFMEMPRYGDETSHDRVFERLIEDRAERDRRIHILQEQVASHDRALDEARIRIGDLQEELSHAETKIREMEAELTNVRIECSRHQQGLLAASRIGASKQAQLDATRDMLAKTQAELESALSSNMRKQTAQGGSP